MSDATSHLFDQETRIASVERDLAKLRDMHSRLPSSRTAEEHSIFDRIWIAERHAHWCARCGKVFGADDQIFLDPRRIAHWRGVRATCADCRSRMHVFLLARPCEFCARPVRKELLGNGGRLGTHTFCSKMCASRVTSTRQRLARAEARSDLKCEQCGEPFEGARKDARYCSPACRQKHHRRVTALKSRDKPSFENRNAGTVTDAKTELERPFGIRNAAFREAAE